MSGRTCLLAPGKIRQNTEHSQRSFQSSSLKMHRFDHSVDRSRHPCQNILHTQENLPHFCSISDKNEIWLRPKPHCCLLSIPWSGWKLSFRVVNANKHHRKIMFSNPCRNLSWRFRMDSRPVQAFPETEFPHHSLHLSMRINLFDCTGCSVFAQCLHLISLPEHKSSTKRLIPDTRLTAVLNVTYLTQNPPLNPIFLIPVSLLMRRKSRMVSAWPKLTQMLKIYRAT